MRRNILKINYDDSNFSIWFDGTHGEIITGIAIVVKRLQDDGMPLEEAIDWIRDYVKNYKHESEDKIIWLKGCFYAHNEKGFPYWPLLFEVIDGLHGGETYEIIGNIHDEGEDEND